MKEFRGKVAQKVGMCDDWRLVDEQAPMIPMVTLVSSASNPTADVQARLFLDNKCHTSMAGTGSICTAACSRIMGSVVNTTLSDRRLEKDTLEIQHPLGVIPVVVKSTPQKGNPVPNYETLSFIRTSRRIMDGKIYVPAEVKDCFSQGLKQDSAANGISPML